MDSLAAVTSFLYSSEIEPTDLRKRKAWASPLTKASREARNIERIVRRKLFESEEIVQVSLSSIYGINLEIPFPNVTEHAFFALRDLLFLIENWTEKNSADKDFIRKHIQLHLNSHLPFEAKLKEIGMLYFYLDRDERVPKELGALESCYLLRMQEIKKELNEINKAHEKLSSSLRKVFPSGRVNYIFRAFVRMILSTEGKYNSGGILGCLELLQDAEICLNLSSEHIYQLRNVLSRFYGNSSTKETLEKSIKPVLEMEDFIRLELKISLNDPLNDAPYVQWACLFALFFDLRQFNEINCFAVGSLRFLIHNYPLIVLQRLFTHFEKGELTIAKKTLSIPSLLEPYLIYEKDVIKEHRSANLLDHPLFQTLMETSEGMPVMFQKKISLRDAFCIIHFEDTKKWRFQEELFGVVKSDILQRLLLCEMELAFFNCDSPSHLNSERSSLLKGITKNLIEKMKLDSKFSDIIFSKEADIFFNHWENGILDKFLIDPRAERNISIQKEENKTYLNFGSIEIREKIECIDDIDRYKKLLGYLGRLTTVENRKLKWVSSFNEIKKTLLREVDQCAEWMDSKKIDDLSKEFKSLIEAEETMEMIAKQLCNNDERDLNAEEIIKLKIPIYTNLGGCEKVILTDYYNKIPLFYCLEKSNSIVNFLEKLCNACFFIHYEEEYNLNLTSDNSLLIASTHKHCFTMLPFLLANLWDNRDKEWSKAIEDKLIKNGKKCAQGVLSRKKIQRILSRVCATKKKEKKLLSYFLKTPFTPLEFYNKLKSKLPQDVHPYLNLQFNEAMLSFSVNGFLTEEVLAAMSIQLTKEKLEKFKEEFKISVGDSLKTPHEYSIVIQKLLASYGIHTIDLLKLENSICHIHDLPEIAYIGDLNYLDSYTEVFSHALLLIKWDFISSSLQFFERHDGEDNITEKESYLKYFRLGYTG